jgi:hypothetical protein
MNTYTYIHIISGLTAAFLTARYIVTPDPEGKNILSYIGCFFLGPIALLLVVATLIYIKIKKLN